MFSEKRKDVISKTNIRQNRKDIVWVVIGMDCKQSSKIYENILTSFTYRLLCSAPKNDYFCTLKQ